MKKLFFSLFTVCLFGLASCGSDATPDATPDTAEVAEEVVAEEVPQVEADSTVIEDSE